MKKLLAFLLLASSVAQGQKITINGGGVSVKDSNVVYPSYDRFKKDSIARAAALAGKQSGLNIVNLKDFTVADGTANDAAAIQSKIASNTTIYLGSYTYNIGTTLSFNGLSNVKFIGNNATISSATLHDLLYIFNATSNLEFSGINFVSTATSSAEQDLGIFTTTNFLGSGLQLDGLYLHDCTFTNAGDNNNAIKLLCENSGNYNKNVKIERCLFKNVGRMGIEVQNNSNLGDYSNITISNNTFINNGTKNIYGQAISLTGKGRNCTISNNHITDSRTHGIEIVGPSDITISGNNIKAINNSFNGIVAGGTSLADSIKNVNYTNNVIDIGVGSELTISSIGIGVTFINGFTVSGNTVKSNNSNTVLGAINGSIAGNTMVSRDYYVMFFGSAANNNKITGNFFSNYNAVVPGGAAGTFCVLQFAGSGVTNNVATENTLYTQASAKFLESSSATGNLVMNMKDLTTAELTLTNKTISAYENTIYGITNSQLSGTAGITGANLSTSIALPSGATATTQPAGTSNTSLATTKFVDSATIYDDYLRAVRAMGSNIKTYSLGMNPWAVNNSFGMADGQLILQAVYVRTPMVLSGVKAFIEAQGVYTADNNNQVALYSSNGTGTLTLVASSANDGNLWKPFSYSLASKAFSAPYSANAGLYYVGMLYNSSAQTTAPTMSSTNYSAISSYKTFDLQNSYFLSGTLSGQNTLPSTITTSAVTLFSTAPYVAVY